jgi:hypothetical protein
VIWRVTIVAPGACSRNTGNPRREFRCLAFSSARDVGFRGREALNHEPDFVPILVTRSQQELLLARSLLDAAGIEYFVENEFGSVLVPTLEPVRVMVRTDQDYLAASVLGIEWSAVSIARSSASTCDIDSEDTLVDDFVWLIPSRPPEKSNESLIQMLPTLDRSFNFALLIAVALLGIAAAFLYPRVGLRPPDVDPGLWMYRNRGNSNMNYWRSGSFSFAPPARRAGDVEPDFGSESVITLAEVDTTIGSDPWENSLCKMRIVSTAWIDYRPLPSHYSRPTGPAIQEIRGTRREKKPKPERPRVF